MMIPRFLKPGDTVGIVSPAGRVDEEGVAASVDIFNAWGLEVVVGKHAFDVYTYLASSDRDRLRDFQSMIDDNSVKAIVASRGGYGCVRLLEGLNLDTLFTHPKWIVGFSDITALHLMLNSHNIPTIHGMMANSPDRTRTHTDSDVVSLYKALFGKPLSYQLPTGINDRRGECRGVVFGGNLSIICSLLGTPYSVDPRGKILVIEDVGECLYKIDRMMQQLRHAGILSQIAGLIVGGITDTADTQIPFGKTVYEIITDAIHGTDYPVCFDFPVGHIGNNNMAIYLGMPATLNVGESLLSFTY